jgi:hypothetical protein
MKRCLFHVACGRGMYMDENGRDFSDLKDAKAYAATIAAELARDGGYVGGAVCIFDESGKELDRVSIGQGGMDRLTPRHEVSAGDRTATKFNFLFAGGTRAFVCFFPLWDSGPSGGRAHAFKQRHGRNRQVPGEGIRTIVSRGACG